MQGPGAAHHPAGLVDGLQLLAGADAVGGRIVQQVGQRQAHQLPRLPPHDARERRIALDDPAFGIKQGLADRRVLHRAAEAFLAASVRGGHRIGQASRARFGGREHPRRGEQQQRNRDAGEQEPIEPGQVRRRGGDRARIEVEAPAPAMQVHRQAVGEGIAALDAGFLVHHDLAQRGDVHDPHLLAATHRGGHRPDHRDHPERQVDPALHRGPARRRRLRLLALVNRRVHQQARDGLGTILHQPDRSGQATLAAVHRGLHRGLAGRLGIHVVADRQQVLGRVWLQEHDRAIVRAPSVRTHLEATATGVAHQQLQGRQSPGIRVGGKAEPDHGGESMRQVHPGRVAAPVRGRWPLHGGHQRCAPLQGELVVVQPFGDQVGDAPHPRAELGLRQLQLALARVAPDADDQGQREHEDQQGGGMAQAEAAGCGGFSPGIGAFGHEPRITMRRRRQFHPCGRAARTYTEHVGDIDIPGGALASTGVAKSHGACRGGSFPR